MNPTLRICAAVDGFPLGLELAAAWLKRLSLAQLAESLEASLQHLSSPLRDVRDRHRSIAAVFEHSWQLLDQPLRLVLCQLAVFRGGCVLEAALGVTQATRDQLEELVDKSLLRTGPNGRVDFHPLLFDCVHAKLDEQTHLKQQAETQHAAFFAARLQTLLAHSRGAYTPTVLDSLLEDAPNFIAALRYSAERAAYQSFIDLAPFLSWHFMLRGQMQDALDLTHELLQRLSAQDLPATGARLTLEVTRATLHMHIGNVSEADHVFSGIDQALFHHADDQLPLAFFEGWGLNDTRRGDYRLAHTRLERALDWARVHHHTAVLLRSLNHLAIAYAFDGAFSLAHKLLEEGHALYLQGHVPNSVDVIWLFTNTGMTQLLQCRYDEALQALETAEAVMRETKSDGFVPLVSMTTALALVERGLETVDHRALERAETLCRNGIPKAVQVGELLAENLMHCVLGRILLERIEIEAARHFLVKGLLSAWSAQDVTAFLWAMPYFLELCFATKQGTLGEAIAVQLLSHPLSGGWVCARVRRILTKYKVVEPASASRLRDSEALAWVVTQVRMHSI